MKLIIDIPTGEYKALSKLPEKEKANEISYYEKIIANGIPYEEKPQGDLISRSYLKQTIPAPIEDEYKYVHQIIDNAPTVNAIPNEEGYEMYGKGYLQGYERGKKERLEGEWIKNNYGKIQCSICKGVAISTMTGCLMDRHLEQYKTKFCPWCGADMRGAE